MASTSGMMTHKCVKCEQRFPSSRAMLQHMRSSHTSFVTSTEQKIDTFQEDSLQEKARCKLPTSASICSYCNLDCGNRRKLKRHIDLNHIEGVDQEIHPDLKHIRLQDSSLDDEPKKLKKPAAIIQEKPSKPIKNPDVGKQKTKNTEVEKGKTNKTTEKSKAAKDNKQTGKDSEGEKPNPTTTKAEKRYKCFWCSTSFRKRGKLMDHIDMFHKDSKDQSELEAEQLYTNEFAEESGATNETDASKPDQKQEAVDSPSESSTGASVKEMAQNDLKALEEVPEERPSSTLSCSFPQDYRECHETPFNDVCKFILLGTITEVAKQQLRSPSHSIPVRHSISMSSCISQPTCYFFRRKEDDPLPIAMLVPKATEQLPAKPTPGYGRSISFPVSSQMMANQARRRISNSEEQLRLSAFQVPPVYRQDVFDNINHINQTVDTLRISQPMYPLLGGPMHMLSPSMQYMYHSPRMPIPLSADPLTNSLMVTERNSRVGESHFAPSFAYAGPDNHERFRFVDSDTPLDLSRP